MKTKKKQAQLYQITNKRNNLNDIVNTMLNKTLTMFEYTGLPDTLDPIIIEKQLQKKGYTVIFKYKNNLYSSVGGLSGQEKSPYNEPTETIINIPAFNLSKKYTLNKDAVLIKNDDLMQGLLPIITKRGTQLVENEISMLLNDYNYRFPFLITAGSDQSINNAQNFLNQIIEGNLGVIAENSFLQDIDVKTASSVASNRFSDLLEYQQYIKGQLYNELGLSSLDNMKKERMITDEVNANNDNIFPLIDNMYRNRQEGFKMVNKLFNGNIQVSKGSSWEDKEQQRPAEQTQENEQNEHQTEESSETEETEPKQNQTTENEQNEHKTDESSEKEETEEKDDKDKKQ